MTCVIVHINRLAIRGFSAHAGRLLGLELRHRLASDIAAALVPRSSRTLHHDGLDPGRKIAIRSGSDNRSIRMNGRAIADRVARCKIGP